MTKKDSVLSSLKIRQDFLDFFRDRRHAIVPSASLLPTAPNLLFTNSGMNQFVPIFLGETACPYRPGRAADTQKCIRAGGKHNDLDDVGWDTYHHTFFEMLGNWSFGDYFKREAIAWAWELLTEGWGFPRERLYATVYSPDRGDPSCFDQEAYDCWAEIFSRAGLDPMIHIQRGNKKDNFWMMGDTGPCGPCSELHADLTQQGDTKGVLVNQSSSECIEIWNLVFIQYNANPDGTLTNLPERHVDTGMGFERVVSIIQNTQGFRDFGTGISNYETDVFFPLFEELQHLSGLRYRSTLPTGSRASLSEQERIDVAFRVIADHVRTLSFAIADGIEPGKTDRNYVLRRILRRAVRQGHNSLKLSKPFLYRLVNVLDQTMGDIFPEVRVQQQKIKDVIQEEEESYGHTLDRGVSLFQDHLKIFQAYEKNAGQGRALPGELAFELYDTHGIPLDLTVQMATQRGFSGVDTARFEELMEEQRQRARAARKNKTIEVSDLKSQTETRFCGYERFDCESVILDMVKLEDYQAVLLEVTPFYPEMGGQVGDTGTLQVDGVDWNITDTKKIGNVVLHRLSGVPGRLESDLPVKARVDAGRRLAIQRHHTATHLFHWALREVVGREAQQMGSYVGPDKFTFDFNASSLTSEQLNDIERLVNERILANEPVHWIELDRAQVERREDILQIFGEKYSERVRVVQIGGSRDELDGFSMELCGGTHVRATGEIGSFKLRSEAAVAAGVRRVEAVAGAVAWRQAGDHESLLRRLSERLHTPVEDLEKKVARIMEERKGLEKQLEQLQGHLASDRARALLDRVTEIPASGDRPAIPLIAANLGSVAAKVVQDVAQHVKSDFSGVVVLGGASGGSATLISLIAAEYVPYVRANDLIRGIVEDIDGKGGGRPDFARGGGKNPEGLDRALARVEPWISALEHSPVLAG